VLVQVVLERERQALLEQPPPDGITGHRLTGADVVERVAEGIHRADRTCHGNRPLAEGEARLVFVRQHVELRAVAERPRQILAVAKGQHDFQRF